MHVTQPAQRRWERYRGILAGGGNSGSIGGGGGRDAGGYGSGSNHAQPASLVIAGRPRVRPGGDNAEEQQWQLQGEHQRQQQQQQQQGQLQQPQQPQQQQHGRKRQRLETVPAPAEEAASGERHHQQQHHHQQPGKVHADAGINRALDTVGCVVVDAHGSVAAGVSSGGIALKSEGRVGEAAVFGAGCWAQDASADNHGGGGGRGSGTGAGSQPHESGLPAVAVSVTGVGEHIMRHLLGRECALRLAQPPLPATPLAVAAGGAGKAVRKRAAGEGVEEEEEEEGPGSARAGEVEGQPGSAAAVCQVAAELLQQTILQGGPPNDCGLLAVTAKLHHQQQQQQPQSSPTQAAARRGSPGPGLPPGEGASRAKKQLPRPGPSMLRVELGVAHCSQSMAVAYCTHPSSSSSGRGSAAGNGGAFGRPKVTFLRQVEGAAAGGAKRGSSSSSSSPAVQVLLHGTSWAVPEGSAA